MTKALVYVEIDVPYCNLQYGVSPCAAQLTREDGSVPNAALFDGDNDFLDRGGGLTGAANSKQLTVSVWIKRDATEDDARIIVGESTLGGGVAEQLTRVVLASGAANFNVIGYNSAQAEIFSLISEDPLPAGRWIHCLCSVDLTDTAKRHMYLNDEADNFTVGSWNDDTIDFTLADWGVGGCPDGDRKLMGEMAELWFAPGVYIDFSVEANRRAFITAAGRPVHLGDNGELPTGSSPLVYLGNAFDSFETNLGTGGGFSLNGSLDGGSFASGTIKCFNTLVTCQDAANYDEIFQTIRFAMPASYLPKEIDCLPCVTDVSFDPAIVSLGDDLGQRASLTVKFRDIRHPDTGLGFDKYVGERPYNPFDLGSFWGKFRARQPYLQGKSIRVIRGTFGQALEAMETRHYTIESTDGPSYDGVFTIKANDVLKLADGDRAQIPAVNTGTLNAAIDNDDLAITLKPSGIGDAEYPSGSNHLRIGGEIVHMSSRTGDVITLDERASFATPAEDHDEDDVVQVVKFYNAEDPANIIYDMLVEYADVDPALINIDDWLNETNTFLGLVFSGVLAEPMSVNKAVSEIIDIAGLAIWFDDRSQMIRLQVLRQISTDADTFTEDERIRDTFKVKEQPDKRLTQIWTYFNQINPLLPLERFDNFRSLAVRRDDEAEAAYGVPAILKRATRWINAGGLTVADRANEVRLGRFINAPRQFSFDLFRKYDPNQDPQIGVGYKLTARNLQQPTGDLDEVPIQITRINALSDRYEVEAEEMRFTYYDADPTTRDIVFDTNQNNVNLREVHDGLYVAPESGDTVNVTIYGGVIIGSNDHDVAAFDVGDWPAGVTINIFGSGRILGRGGNGGNGAYFVGSTPFAGESGSYGGTALLTAYPINMEMDGEIWGGGGGGGGGGAYISVGFSRGGDGGGGGIGYGSGGTGGNAAVPGDNGFDGTADAGGAGGISNTTLMGGAGSSPGSAGAAGTNGGSANGGAGGAAGAAVDGDSFVTYNSSPDIQGAQIN
jgi:hypothetical protein